MQARRWKGRAMLLVAALAACATPQAKADTYVTYRVSFNSGSVSNTGLMDDGSLTTFSANTLLYSTFSPATGTTTLSAVAPTAGFDNGAPCSVSVAGLSGVSNAKCNDGYTVFEAYTGNSVFSSLYLWHNTVLQQLYHGPEGNVLLDGMGDVAFVGMAGTDADTNFLLYDTTTHLAPEPESVWMMLSGSSTLALGLWRRSRKLRG